MLDPEGRRLLTESLRPPDGYELGFALGTTFTLDLLALLTAPLSFALFDWDSGDEQQAPDPLALLESLRKYASRMAVFCQAGQIKVPRPDQVLYSYLEKCIIEARAPARHGLFHPKLWVLRFEGNGARPLYRLICMSRNMTFDPTWDAAVMLEGEVVERKRAFGRNHPLGDFIATLPDLAIRPIAQNIELEIKQIAEEIRMVDWELPEEFEEAWFWPLGVDPKYRLPFEGRVDRLLVVSPFLGAEALELLTEEGKDHILISCIEALQTLEPGQLGGFKELFTLNDATYPESLNGDKSREESGGPTGLHAKIYIADAGRRGRVWVGSANATHNGFRGNVEFLVELEGTKSQCGIEAVLRADPGSSSLANLLVRYDPRVVVRPDETEEKLRKNLDEVRYAIARAPLTLAVRPVAQEKFALDLLVRGRRSLSIPAHVQAVCWPIRLKDTFAVPFHPNTDIVASFEVTLEEITSFLAFGLRAVEGSKTLEERFSLNLPLENDPPDRHQAVLRSILKDRDRLTRFLLFLLADGVPDNSIEMEFNQRERRLHPGSAGDIALPLFEALVRALDRDPTRLDQIASLIHDLRESGGISVLPEGFDLIWEPIWAAREAMR